MFDVTWTAARHEGARSFRSAWTFFAVSVAVAEAVGLVTVGSDLSHGQPINVPLLLAIQFVLLVVIGPTVLLVWAVGRRALRDLGVSSQGVVFRLRSGDVSVGWTDLPEPKASIVAQDRAPPVSLLTFQIRVAAGRGARKILVNDREMLQGLLSCQSCPKWAFPLAWWRYAKLNPPPGWPVK